LCQHLAVLFGFGRGGVQFSVQEGVKKNDFSSWAPLPNISLPFSIETKPNFN